MSDTMQSLDQLSQLKPAAPDAPKYVKKVDKYGRAYATGKRKNAVARVWVKPGNGKVTVTDGTVLVEGPKGKVTKTFADSVKVTVADKKVTFAPTADTRFAAPTPTMQPVIV